MNDHEPGRVRTALADDLSTGLASLGLDLPANRCDKLLNYLDLLHKWNAVYNLTAIRDLREMLSRHLLDSLSLLPFLSAGSLLDIGTGAGLPGIPVAIACPEKAVTLLDSNGKKTRFLTHAKSQLGLENVTVAHARVQQFQPVAPFAAVTSRAFASLSTFVTQCSGLCRADGEIVAMLGAHPEADELAALGERVIAIESLTVPGNSGERHIARVIPRQ